MHGSVRRIFVSTASISADAYRIFYGFTVTEEDAREAYGERRFVTVGMLNGVNVVVTHAERADSLRIISMRKATRHETQTYFESLAD
jgi:uncharacterized DUF497 family protein